MLPFLKVALSEVMWLLKDATVNTFNRGVATGVSCRDDKMRYSKERKDRSIQSSSNLKSTAKTFAEHFSNY